MTLGERMKQYEHTYRHYLPRRTYTLLRLDGRSFHSFTKGFERPFDQRLVDVMNYTAVELCREIAGAQFAYVQSDEISILVTDFENHETQPWMGGNIAKVLSLSASCATAAFNSNEYFNKDAMFDSRVWTMSDANEVANYFIWRQRDCVKNSITMAAQTVASHKELEGLNSKQRQELLFERGINWNDYADGLKRGRAVWEVLYPGPLSAGRYSWTALPAPHFKFEPENWLMDFIPDMPSLPRVQDD